MKTAFNILATLVLFISLTACDNLQREAAKDTLKIVGIQIAEAATKAAAETALQAAEAELAKIEASPLPINPITALVRTAAINQARKLVEDARRKAADIRFTDRK